MFYLYVDLCTFADVDIVAIAINASTAIRLLYVNTKEVVQAVWSSSPGGSVKWRQHQRRCSSSLVVLAWRFCESGINACSAGSPLPVWLREKDPWGMVQLRGNLGSGGSLGILSISLEIKEKFLKTLEVGGPGIKQVGHGPWRAEGREVQVGGLQEGKLSPGSPVDKRPWQVRWTALPRHRFGGHWRWTRAVGIPGRNP